MLCCPSLPAPALSGTALQRCLAHCTQHTICISSNKQALQEHTERPEHAVTALDSTGVERTCTALHVTLHDNSTAKRPVHPSAVLFAAHSTCDEG